MLTLTLACRQPTMERTGPLLFVRSTYACDRGGGTDPARQRRRYVATCGRRRASEITNASANDVPERDRLPHGRRRGGPERAHRGGSLARPERVRSLSLSGPADRGRTPGESRSPSGRGA